MSASPTVRQVRRVAAVIASCVAAHGAVAGAPTSAGASGDPARIAAIAGVVAQDPEGPRHGAAAPVARVTASRSDGFFVAPGRDAAPPPRRPSPKPDDRAAAPAVAEALDEPVSGSARAMLVLLGLIGWIAARRSR